ncbi:hypothetical protein BDZ45DRAFT_607608 [Acephala macrosclerotiorum]|nr:hypothetical protein BDZ45DRAFT_607608 [Acephala macrosclerotiorum]
MSETLIVATPCTTHNAAIDHLLSTLGISTAMSTLAATSDTDDEMTIAITNSYGAQVSLSFGLNAGFPSPLGDPQPTKLPDSSSTQYLYPTGWAGRVNIGPNLSPYGSKIEGSFIVPKNATVAIPDIDVSYVDGYSVPITCSTQGIAITGCNIDLFKEAKCSNQTDGPVCLNPAVNLDDGPPPSFFAPCAGAAYTFPKDNEANVNNFGSNSISCCIGTSCEAPPRQL